MPSDFMQRWVSDYRAKREHATRVRNAAQAYWTNIQNALRHDIEYLNNELGGDEEVALQNAEGFWAKVVQGDTTVSFELDPDTGRITYALVGDPRTTGTISEPTLDADGLNLSPPGGSYDVICEKILGPILPKR